MFSSATFTTVVESLAARIFGLTPTVDSSSLLDESMQVAYNAFAAENRVWVEGLFDEHFLAKHGEPIVAAYVDGHASRHQAAVKLAEAWERNIIPASVKLSKQRRADAVMAADRFLTHVIS